METTDIERGEMTKALPVNTERVQTWPVFKRVLPDGTLAEMIYDSEKAKTSFAVWNDDEVNTKQKIGQLGRTFVPYSPRNSLIEHGVILLPSGVQDYGSEQELLAEIEAFIHRYVDITPIFERLSAYYVLFTWLFDQYQELPYLRFIGDYGSGKSRAIKTIGSLCYRPIFATGASTVSPLFRILDSSRSTLVLDEADLKRSNETDDLIKILNQGNARGFPVLRSETINQREFSPRAYQVFGPKIISTRSLFQDKALESRCLTETMGARRLRNDIPINLNDDSRKEAQAIRNKLLMFRFRHFGKMQSPSWIDRRLEPRLNQVIAPLMSIIQSDEARQELRDLAFAYQAQMVSDRSLDAEAQVLEVIQELTQSEGPADLSIKKITEVFLRKFEKDYDRKITPHWIGRLIRERLGLRTQRRQGNYMIAMTERPKYTQLFEKYGLICTEEAVAGFPIPPEKGSGDSDDSPRVRQ